MAPPPTTRALEHLWLRTACAYECFDETLMPDTEWDIMAKDLNERRLSWSPYFTAVIPGGRGGDYNVGTTASGIDWHWGLAKVFYEALAGSYGRDPLGIIPK
jgi:hypothetical protein